MNYRRRLEYIVSPLSVTSDTRLVNEYEYDPLPKRTFWQWLELPFGEMCVTALQALAERILWHRVTQKKSKFLTYHTVEIDTTELMNSFNQACCDYVNVTGREPEVLLLGRDQYRAFETFSRCTIWVRTG